MLHVEKIPGLISYSEAYARQQQLVQALAAVPTRDAHLLLLQHTPVYTLGRTTKIEHLPGSVETLTKLTGAEVVSIDRGGSVTYHGPGQLTAYVILHLKAWDTPIHQHLWNLEEVVIRVLNAYGLSGSRVEGMTGVWSLTPSEPIPAKVCAVGVGCKRWVTYHGIGLNFDLDLAPFTQIDPCGLGRKPVTTLSKLTGKTVTFDEACERLSVAFEELLKIKRS